MPDARITISGTDLASDVVARVVDVLKQAGG
jgi:hypothetical protein